MESQKRRKAHQDADGKSEGRVFRRILKVKKLANEIMCRNGAS
jgi:hypothetical protein